MGQIFGKDSERRGSLSEIIQRTNGGFFFHERMLRATIGWREGRERGVIHSDENAVSMIVIENPIK